MHRLTAKFVLLPPYSVIMRSKIHLHKVIEKYIELTLTATSLFLLTIQCPNCSRKYVKKTGVKTGLFSNSDKDNRHGHCYIQVKFSLYNSSFISTFTFW